jgi:hypothetical protein
VKALEALGGEAYGFGLYDGQVEGVVGGLLRLGWVWLLGRERSQGGKGEGEQACSGCFTAMLHGNPHW